MCVHVVVRVRVCVCACGCEGACVCVCVHVTKIWICNYIVLTIIIIILYNQP